MDMEVLRFLPSREISGPGVTSSLRLVEPGAALLWHTFVIDYSESGAVKAARPTLAALVVRVFGPNRGPAADALAERLNWLAQTTEMGPEKRQAVMVALKENGVALPEVRRLVVEGERNLGRPRGPLRKSMAAGGRDR